jgi:hypothetical protein
MDSLVSVDSTTNRLLQNSCGDCHSSSTVWPWYSRVAPVSWLVVSDVNRGRHAMSLSEWSAYSPQHQHELLGQICEEVAAGEMAPIAYRLVHARARLSQSDRQVLCTWSKRAAGSSMVGRPEGEPSSTD